MKLRSKLLLSATCLLTISVAATATSAYAWFTANRQAFVSATGMTVKSDVDEIFIQEVKEGTSPDKTATLVAPGVTTDVSGNGLELYKPSFKNADASVANSVTKVDSSGTVDSKPVYYFNEFTLKFTKENENVTTGLFFSYTSTIEKAKTAQSGPDLSGAYRVAVLDASKQNLLAYYAPKDAASTMKYVYTDALGNENKIQTKSVATELGLAADYSENLLDSSFKKDITDDDKPTAASKPKSYLGTIDPNKGLTLVVRIWCEGTDGDCKTESLLGKVDVNLVFNGVTMVA